MTEEKYQHRILLVDDDEGIRRDYTKVLRRQGLTTETASNGKEAAERVKAGSFDVIVSDISMPEMTGIEFLKAVRAHDLDARLHKMARLKGEALELPGTNGRRLVSAR